MKPFDYLFEHSCKEYQPRFKENHYFMFAAKGTALDAIWRVGNAHKQALRKSQLSHSLDPAKNEEDRKEWTNKSSALFEVLSELVGSYAFLFDMEHTDGMTVAYKSWFDYVNDKKVKP